ncbi:MAG: CPBP family intramembrane glutamic endopeptidase [Oceanicaulis sp.]
MTDQINPDYLLLVPAGCIGLFHLFQALRESQWKRELSSDAAPDARSRLYREGMASLWALAAVCVIFWLFSGRDLAGLGFRLPDSGWRAWLVWGLSGAAAAYFMVWVPVTLALSRKDRIKTREMIRSAEGVDLIRPRTPAEHRLFPWLAGTAGVTEEIIFRGFLIGALSVLMPVWAAALVSVAVFTAAHAYQGVAGLVRVLPMAALLAGVFVIGGSLWPVIIIHIAADLSAGAVFRILDAFDDNDQEAGADAPGGSVSAPEAAPPRPPGSPP